MGPSKYGLTNSTVNSTACVVRYSVIFVAQYAEEYSRAYQGPLAPHIFAVAAVAYQDMVRENRDQCCVISGTAIVDITHHTHTLSLCVYIHWG